MTVTIKDIAKIAGVSHTTVSRALNDHPGIPPVTITKIKQIAFDLGYVPDALARGLKTSRTRALGVILSSIDDPFFSEVLQGIEDDLQSTGYSLFVASSHYDQQREEAIVHAMGERRVDGVIVCSTSFSGDQARQLQKYGMPIAVINNQAAEEYRYSIYHDDISGSRLITRHLLELGHTRIAYLGNHTSGRSNQDRLSGFLSEMKSAGCPIHDGYIFEQPGGDPQSGEDGLRYFLRLPEQPTAIFCYNDRMALGVLHGLAHAGKKVPADCSVVGFDNIAISAFTIPSLTTFDQPKYDMGHDAAQMMLNLLDSPSESGVQSAARVRVLQGKLLIRESTAPPRNKNYPKE